MPNNTAPEERPVNETRMMERLAQLARWSKHAATPGEMEGLRFLESCLRDSGFHTNCLLHDAYISQPGAARLHAGGRDIPCITHSFSRATPEGGLRGRVLDAAAGTGMSPSEAWRSRIVLRDGIATPAAVAEASRAGAAAQIHVSPHEHRHEMCVSPVWGSPTPETLGELPATVVISITRGDGEALRELVARDPAAELVIEAAVDTGWRQTPILLAEMQPPGAEADLPFVLFSGHQDSWHHGVMDNGAANIAMVEVAHVLAGMRSRWRRGLRLAFWSGHSQGRYSGSTWYADSYWEELCRRCVAHVNIDSTGGQGSSLLENAESMAVLRPLAREAVQAGSGQHLAGRRMARAGDQSFNGIGLPAMLMGVGQQADLEEERDGRMVNRRLPVGLGWWWHTPEDTLDKIDPQLQARDARIYVHALRRLLEDEVLPLDVTGVASELDLLLDQLSKALAGRFDLAPLRLGTARLMAAARQAQSAPASRLNPALMAACRALLPMEYTGGDRFSHDAALPQPAYPVLDPLRHLAGSAPGSDEARFLTVAALRARNRLAHALDLAASALEAADVAAAASSVSRA